MVAKKCPGKEKYPTRGIERMERWKKSSGRRFGSACGGNPGKKKD